jgi:hypothetical protein
MRKPHCIEPKLATARILLVFKAFGVSRGFGLGITASMTARVLRRHGVWAEAWPAGSADQIRGLLKESIRDADARGMLEPTHVIILAPWLETGDVAALASEFPNVTFVIASHFNFGFLGADPHAVKLLRELVDLQHETSNVRVAGNSEKFTRVATEIWSTDVATLPNLYDMGEPMPAPRHAWPRDCLRLGLFGAGRVLKNGTTAAAAAALLATSHRVPTELFVSTDVDSGGITSPIRELVEGTPNLRIVDAGWLPWPKFRRLVGHMHLLLQPSFTESFNVVTADGIWAGVPTAASTAIDWVPPRWQANPDDAADVARIGEYLLHCPRAVEEGRAALERHIERGVEEWRRFVAPRVAASAAA